MFRRLGFPDDVALASMLLPRACVSPATTLPRFAVVHSPACCGEGSSPATRHDVESDTDARETSSTAALQCGRFAAPLMRR